MAATYDRIMKGINDQTDATRMLAHRALAWIINVKRLLIIEELLFAVSLKPPERPCYSYNGNYEGYSESAVLSSCRGLVTNAWGTIRPIHFTVQEFLRDRGLEPSKGVNASIFVTQSILVYLRSVRLERDSASDLFLASPFPQDLLRYTCGFLGHHLCEAGNPLPACLLKLVKVLMQKRHHNLRWIILQKCGDPELVRIDAYEPVKFFDPNINDFNLSPLGLLSGLDLLPLYFQLYPNVVEKEELMAVFHAVVRGGSVFAVKALLRRGCDIESRDSSENTPLIAAASSGCEPMVLFLVREGADVHPRSEDEYSALDYACERGMARAVRILLERGADQNVPIEGSSLLTAALWGNAAVVKVLLEYGNATVVQALIDGGGDVNQTNHLGGTLLCDAVRWGNVGIAKALIAAGADIEKGCPLYVAALDGSESSPRAVKVLREVGAEVNTEWGHYGSALWAAAIEGNLETVQILLDAGARVGVGLGVFSSKSDALEKVASRGLVVFVKALLDSGADVNPHTALYAAVSNNGSAETVQMLLAAGADVNLHRSEIFKILLDAGADVTIQRSKDQGTALYAAAAHRKISGAAEIAQLLVDAGADVNAEGGEHGSALVAAAYTGSREIVKILLEAGADVNRQAHGKYLSQCAPGAAAGAGGIEILELLRASGARDNIDGEYYGPTLSHAAGCSHIEMVRFLLDPGNDVNIPAEEYPTGNIEIFKTLVAADIGVNIEVEEYGKALYIAAHGYHSVVVKVLLDYGADINIQLDAYGIALCSAINKDDISAVRLLLDVGEDVNIHRGPAGADANTVGGEHGTALHAAISVGDEEMVEMLLKVGANVNLQGKYYSSPLHVAACNGETRMVKILVDAGADVDMVGEDGTALQIAARECWSPDTTKTLLAAGAGINVIGGKYGTALLAATDKGSIAKEIKILVDAGADVNIEWGEYCTALQMAAGRHSIEILRILLNAGTDVNIQGGKYGTALRAATYKGSIEMVKILVRAGADVNAWVEGKGAALQLAVRKGLTEISQYLRDAGADEESSG
ncbi:uncharacterized protein LAJ45_08298 [Morchella importuna]|uniref:uncharacterized protein n=1 Tax=Morchella importuna TaxID=1174673 RepID=UPI001E8CF922|nr:uncharacterized protein LAJ45_08298 [Morchella importuna]KAH8147832.1 hypothetical protein LAJ45_08298 [Morchella importuna]